MTEQEKLVSKYLIDCYVSQKLINAELADKIHRRVQTTSGEEADHENCAETSVAS